MPKKRNSWLDLLAVGLLAGCVAVVGIRTYQHIEVIYDRVKWIEFRMQTPHHLHAQGSLAVQNL